MSQNSKLEQAIARALSRVPDNASGVSEDAAAIARIVISHLGDLAEPALVQALAIVREWKAGGQ